VTLVIALLPAWALDLCFGEPRSAWHPVAWLGSPLAPLGRVLVFASAIAWAAWAAQKHLLGLSPWFAAPLLALLLKPTFSWRMLRDEVAAVEVALAHGLDAGRARLARIVSRDVNVLDADDALSWLPARQTALLLRPALRLQAWQCLRSEARHTPSPNGGWPMAAMALRLGVRLRKPGVYALNANAPPPTAGQLAQALRFATHAAWAALVLAVLGTAARVGGP
jgi:adenosylcobinamide-phosphate synthase